LRPILLKCQLRKIGVVRTQIVGQRLSSGQHHKDGLANQTIKTKIK